MYRGRLEKDLSLWVKKGLLTDSVAKNLLQEFDSRENTFSVGQVLTILAACLFSAAVLLLVASNWEAIPRIIRLVGILVLVWGFFISGASLQERGNKMLAGALLVIGAAIFGGAISLVGQMYHLSGDMGDFALVWFAGVAVAGILFRSVALTVVSGFLSWLVFGMTYNDLIHIMDTNLPWLTLGLAAIVLGMVYWTGATQARHTAYLLILSLITAIYLDINTWQMAAGLVVAGTVLYLLAALPQSPLHRFSVQAGPAPEFYAYVVGALGLALLHFESMSVERIALLGVLSLAYSILGLVFSGRNNGVVRYLAYLIFAAECLYLASETVGSILGTAGLFLTSGIIVGIIAWIVIRLEKRFSTNTGTQGAN